MKSGRASFLASFIRMFDGASVKVDRQTPEVIEGIVAWCRKPGYKVT